MKSKQNLTISETISSGISAGLARAIPEKALTVSTWAEQYRFVAPEAVANSALPGRWKNDLTPYLVEIMDAVNDPGVNEIIFLKSAQVGGTELLLNVIGYYIHVEPSTILFVGESEAKAKMFSTEKLSPMIRETPVLSSVFGEAKMTNSSNMIEAKSFPGGHIAIGWATSPATLSSRARKILLTDETEAFEGTKEGDPIDLAETRTRTAGHERKIVHVSTPRSLKSENLKKRYDNSTAEKLYLPCPHCDEYQQLVWANVRWEDDPRDAYYICEHCGAVIEHEHKSDMIAAGEWRSTNPDYVGNRRGFWMNGLYSPFQTWGDLAVKFLESKSDKMRLQTFTNVNLAEYWDRDADAEQIDYNDLGFQKEEYEAEVPAGVILLTAAVDTQDDRLECEVVGWGRDQESWSIDYRVFRGDPGKNDIWQELREYLLREFDGVDGRVYKIKATAIDSGGHHAQSVYKFCRDNSGRRFWAIKGVFQGPISHKPTWTDGAIRCRLYKVGTDAAKDRLFSYLKTQEPGPGYCHFPEKPEYDEAYFKMLSAERKVPKMRMGKEVWRWEKVSEKARNEAFDLRVYNLAAYTILNPDLKSFARAIERKADPRKNKPENDDKLPESAPKIAKKPQKTRFIPRKKGGFVRNW